MKKIIFIIALTVTVFSCNKKKPVDPEPAQTETVFAFTSKLDNPLNGGGSLRLDSTEVSVYRLKNGDSTLVKTAYTNEKGEASFALSIGKNYCIVAVSRTYKFSYKAQQHHYEYSENIMSVENTSYPIIAYFYPGLYIYGNGCTSYYIQDPSE